MKKKDMVKAIQESPTGRIILKRSDGFQGRRDKRYITIGLPYPDPKNSKFTRIAYNAIVNGRSCGVIENITINNLQYVEDYCEDCVKPGWAWSSLLP